MKTLINYAVLIIIFSLGVFFGNISATPGKSESHAILDNHGTLDIVDSDYLVYIPDNKDLSVEEFEALAVVSKLYEHIEVIN